MTPRQTETWGKVFGGGRPSYEADFAAALRARIESSLREDVERLDGEVLLVGKSHLMRIHRCEGEYAARRKTFERTPTLIGGTVGHKMIQSVLGAGEAVPSLQLADEVVASMTGNPESEDGAYLSSLSPVELAEVTTTAANAATTFASDWPAQVRRLKPRVEISLTATLLNGRVKLNARPDILFGAPAGTEARVVIVDVKTGSPRSSDLEDLRFYALFQTLRDSVPPFRVVSYYTQAGVVQVEDVTPETLAAAERRFVDGVRAMTELPFRAPKLIAGRHCEWCPARGDCDAGRMFLSAAFPAVPPSPESFPGEAAMTPI